MGDQDLEKRIREIGLQLHSAIDEVPSIFDKRGWIGRLMDWTMKDETFRFNLFRYIDLLPSLKTDDLVVRLLKEYFADGEETPAMIREVLGHLPAKGIFPSIEAKVIRSGIEGLAREFIAEKEPKAALHAVKTLWEGGLACSVDLLGEVVVSDREARGYGERYLEILNVLVPEVGSWKENRLLEEDDKGPIPRLDISFKISSFYSQLDPLDWEGSIEEVEEGLRPVIEKAKQLGASVCFDMEHYYYKDLTLAVFKSVAEEFRDYPFIGIALQAYIKDARKDFSQLLEWAKAMRRRITIRLVKGAYWDYEIVTNRQKGWPVPVFLDKEETDSNFEELTGLLLANSEWIRTAIATHNIRSISNALAVAESLKLPEGSFEFQMLYGMGDPIRKTLGRMRKRVRVYTPVGELIPGMAYLVRRLLENTSNTSFLRNFFSGKMPFEEMMRAPNPGKNAPEEEPIGDRFQNEPPTDFSVAANRIGMKEALKKVRGDFNKKYPIRIGDREVWTEKETLSLNPSRPSEIVGRVSSASRENAEKALRVARKAWDFWKKVRPGTRAAYLFKAASLMREKRFELAALEVYEVGKTWRDADADVVEAIDYLEYYGREMMRLGTPQHLGNYPGEENEYRYEPRGVGVVISPWNFPLAIPTGMASAAIVTGNCVIFKPSGLSAVTGSKLAEIFMLTGLPPGVLQFLPGSGEEVGDFLVKHPEIDFVAFTGSRDVGLGILRHAAETHQLQKNIKRVIAEMGGKNAIIVDETADLDEAVKGVVESSLGYQGQKCSACSRVIVAEPVYEEFCGRLKDAIESIRIGPSELPGTFAGPVIDDKALKKIEEYIEAGKREGQAVLFDKPDGAGYFIGPALLLHVAPDSAVAQEEIFGPVLVVMKSKDIDEAIIIANNTRYALTGGLFSRSPTHIGKVKDEFRVGNLYLNRRITGALVGRQPFGGFGMSGVGSKAGGPDYLLQFTNSRSISENTLRRGFAPLDRG